MTTKASHILLVLTAFVAGLAIFAGVMLYATGQFGNGGPAPSAIGGPFKLTSHTGEPVTEADFKGKPYLVFFGFTHCPDICPATLFEVSEVFRALGKDADRAAALFVTVDPERDTPAVMKDYMSSFDPHVIGATGDAAAVAAAERTFRVYSRKVPTGDGQYTVDHSSIVYLMNKDGRFVAPFNLKRKPEEAAAELRKYL